MSDWGVWISDIQEWFKDAKGDPIVYASEAEARSVMHNLNLLLPTRGYEARPLPESST